MKTGQKLKAQRIVDDIQSDCFKDRDVDTLLILLRDYSRQYKTFRDVADFVAHTDARDRGPSFTSVERLMSFSQLNFEYIIPKKSLEIDKPFPTKWIKFIHHQVGTLDNNISIKLLGVGTRSALSKIEKEFSLKKQKTQLRTQRLSQSTEKAIKIFSEKPHNPVSPNQHNFIRETHAICASVGLTVDESLFLSQSDKITTCILALIHQSEFKGSDGYKCVAEIGFPTTINDQGKTEPKININGAVYLERPYGEKELNIVINQPILTTDLLATKWAPSILPAPDANGLYGGFSGAVALDNKFRLVPITQP